MKYLRKELRREMFCRYIRIDKMIKEKGFPNTTKIARELEVSIPTVSRDIEALRRIYGAPIEYSREKNGYYYSKQFTEFDRFHKMQEKACSF